MNSQLIKLIQSPFLSEDRKEMNIRTWMEIEVHQKIQEGSKTRIQKFKGLVIKTSGKTALEKTFTVRKVSNGFSVERIFTLHSPTIEKIDILRRFKVRRKNIAFIRNLTGKAARLKEIK